jgi:hypothetical protein
MNFRSTRCRLLRVAIIFVLANFSLLAQGQNTPLLGPFNSDALTQRGISPRVLDVAVTPMSQGLKYESLVQYAQTMDDGSSGTERFRMTFDPNTSYGRDLFIELEGEPLRSAKQYRRILEVSMGADYWLRKKDHVYLGKSIALQSSENGEDVIAFRYSPRRVPSSMGWLTRISGLVYVVDGRLDRIELTGEKSFERDGIRHENYQMTVYFGAVDTHGGHVISAMTENFRARINGQWRDVDMRILMLDYSTPELGSITWNNSSAQEVIASMGGKLNSGELAELDTADEKLTDTVVAALGIDIEPLSEGDVVRLDLQRSLPFYSDEVRKLGFELPKTYGLGLAMHYQISDIDVQGFTVAGIDITEDVPLVDPLGSDIESEVFVGQLRADFWILPFLNLNLSVGEMETRSDVTLRFTPGFRRLVELTHGEEIPEFYNFDTNTSGTTVGLGLLTGFQYEQLVMSLGLNYIETITNETNSEIEALLLMGIVGYDFGDIGLQALAGVQYLDTDRTIEGRIDLNDGQPLIFSVDVGLEETTFILGFNKDIGRNWTLASFLGSNGTKSSATMNFGYRW